jgi:uncharacterized protein
MSMNDRRFHPAPVLLVWLGSMALLLWGLLQSPFPYSDPRFVVVYAFTEIKVAAFLALCTLLFLPPRQVGLRAPERADLRLLLPLAIQFTVAFIAWAVARWPTLAAPPVSPPALHILHTTMIVGLTEEWVYRGVLFAALSAWLGLHRGAWLSLAAFGLLHALNLAGGQPPVAVAAQVLLAALSGANLLLAALATRSLWVPMVLHGLYDFLVIDRARLALGDDLSGVFTLLLLAAGPLLGFYSLYRIRRLPDRPPYADH